MYNYSPISSMAIKNFRNIGDIILDFTESPIISLIGDNEAGKTSVVKAFGVCALHATPRDQKDFIRDGTSGFGVAIQLADGSIIVRMKTSTVNKYQVKYSNGEVWETTKIDSGLPVQVQELMGLIEEPETKEFLQIRTYEDQLLFVVTPASTNYKVMYDALKVDQLTRAIKLGSQESNSLKSKISDNEISIKTLTDNLRQLKTYDIEPLLNIKKRVENQLNILEKLEKALAIKNQINKCESALGSLALINENNLKQINESMAMKINDVGRLLNKLFVLGKLSENIKPANSLEIADVTILNKISNIIYKKRELKEKMDSAEAMLALSMVSEVNELQVNTFNRVMKLKNNLDKAKQALKVIDTSNCELVKQSDFDVVMKLNRVYQISERNKQLEAAYEQCIKFIEQVMEYLKQCGVATSNCPNCGETVIFDLDLLEKI